MTIAFLTVDGTEHRLASVVSPGDEDRLFNTAVLTDGIVGVDGCTVGDLIAYGPDGTEVARHPPPLCLDSKRGPNVWIIESSNTKPSSLAPTGLP